MARKRSPRSTSTALATLADSAGGALATRDQILALAGITNERLAQITRIIIDETLAAAQGAQRQQPVVVATGRGLSEVQIVTMPDEALRQRCREALTALIGIAPSKTQTVQTAVQVNVIVAKREFAVVDGQVRVIDVKPTP
jgi:hypothetical protein